MTSIDLGSGPQDCAARIAQFLERRGIDRVFGLQGGHIQPIWDWLGRLGIRMVDVRDEGAAVHMAHAHAELTGGFGVAMVTAGPGVTNCVTAMANASLARVPLLLIGGDPPAALLRTEVPDALVLEDWMRPKPLRRIAPDPAAVEAAVDAVWSAHRPVVVAGRGARGASDALVRFLDATGALYLDTQKSRGLVPADPHPSPARCAATR